MTTDSGPKSNFWQTGLSDLERQLGAGRDGLSSAEAAARQLRYGPNTLEERRRVSLPLRFLSRFRNPLVLILLAAAAISALTGDLSSFIIIAAIVLTSAMLDTVQEYRAEAAAERLKTSVALKEQVLRDGREITVLGRDLVPGDVVLLAAGDPVPADGRVVEAKDFFVNEALLTGESYPSEKHANDEGVGRAEVAKATNAAFMGSSVMNGSARLMICGTGHSTQLGEISSSLRTASPPSALDLGTHKFGMLIVRFTEVLVLFVLLINLLFHRPWLDSFLFAVALAVGLTPELLPMIISVTLARGAIRMAKAQVIVKRLGAIHDLGSMDVLCTDKTGTLTEAKISLARQVALSGAASERVLDLAWLATQVLVIFVLRTRRNPFRSRPHAVLAATSIAVVLVALLLPFTPLGGWFGFVPPSVGFLLAIAGLTVSYLLLAQIAKQAFYRVWPPSVGPPAPLLRAHLLPIGRS